METLSEDIRIGMKVFDSEGHHIGKVDNLKFPENAIAPDTEVAEVDDVVDERGDTIVDVIADAFGHEEIEEPLRSRLLRDGYIHLDANGLFASDRYVLPEQIAGLNAEGIELNVTRDALFKKPN
jgi:hypothetical protein